MTTISCALHNIISMKSRKKRFPLFSLLPLLLIAVSLPLFVIALVTNTFEVRSRAADGTYYCSGCSNVKPNMFARWKSTTSNCEGVIEGSQLYTTSCGCPGNTESCKSSKPPPFVCSGCDTYKSQMRMFVTWLSRYPDCSDKIQDPAHGINPVYVQDPYCALYAGQRATPTPTPMPAADFCKISVANNPCYVTNYTTTGAGKCTTKIDWSANRDITIYFQTARLRQTPQSLLPVSSNRNLLLIGGSYYYWAAASGPGTNSKWFQIEVIDSPVKFAGVINGVAKCKTEASAVQWTGEVPIPTLVAPDCHNVTTTTVRTGRDESGHAITTRVATSGCPNEGRPGSQVIGTRRRECKSDEVLCGLWLDACGCPGIYTCRLKTAGCGANGIPIEQSQMPTPRSQNSGSLDNQFSTFFQNFLHRNR